MATQKITLLTRKDKGTLMERYCHCGEILLPHKHKYCSDKCQRSKNKPKNKPKEVSLKTKLWGKSKAELIDMLLTP
jgi:predicted nucleic acid-binding Zn ribbon protein